MKTLTALCSLALLLAGGCKKSDDGSGNKKAVESTDKSAPPPTESVEIAISCGSVGKEFDTCKEGVDAWSKKKGTAKEDVALTPLAIPMLAGPGAISTVIVISGQARGVGQTAVVYLAIILTGVASYVALRIGEPLLRRIGKTGIRVMTRIMGLLLAALAVQFVLSGVKEAFQV